MITLLSIREADMNEGGFIIRSEVEGKMASRLCLLFITLTIDAISIISVRAESLLGQEIPILAKPYDKSAFIDVRDDKRSDIILKKESKPKSLSDFGDFLCDTENAYAGI
jgi:hypothetical protein